MSIEPQAKKIESALHYFQEIRQENPQQPVNKLIEKTVLRFDLSPKDSETLYHHLKPTPQE